MDATPFCSRDIAFLDRSMINSRYFELPSKGSSSKPPKCKFIKIRRALCALLRPPIKEVLKQSSCAEHGSSTINRIVIYGKNSVGSGLPVIDLRINTAHVTPAGLSVSLFIKCNPLWFYNCFHSDSSQYCSVHCALTKSSPPCVPLICTVGL